MLSFWDCEHCLWVDDILLARIVLYSWFNTVALKPTWLLLKMSLDSDPCQPSWVRWLPLFPLDAVGCWNSMRHFSISDALKLTRQVLWLSCFPRPSRSGWLGLPRLAWCPVETCLSGVGWLYSRITLQLDNVAIRGAHWESVFSLIGTGLSVTQWHLEYLGKLSTCNCQELGLLCCLWFGLLLSPETAISRHLWHRFLGKETCFSLSREIRKLLTFPSLE